MRETDPKQLQERAERLLASDHFAALGVTRTASPDEVQKAFVEAAKQWHPDRVPSSAPALAPLFARVFGRLEVARATLADPMRRVKYVEELTGPKRPSEAGAAEAALELKKAEVLLKRNDLAQAETHLRRAVNLAPGHVLAQVLLVWVQATPTASPDQLGKLVAELDRLVRLDEKCERAYFFRAQLRKRLGREREAHADFVRAAELDKNNIDAQREVRLYNMRQQKASSEKTESAKGGVGALFQKLFKR